VSGKTLGVLAKTVVAKGFDVLAGHSLRMPENYPPMIKLGMGAAKAPSVKRMADFDSFISELGVILTTIENGRDLKRKKVRPGWVFNLYPSQPRTAARKDMGEKFVDASLCTECGTCERNCPYDAIRLEPKPIFDMGKCYGCWICYNQCPTHAIYTKKFRGGPFYPEPSELLKSKLIA
jgi:ferredoxin